MVGNTDAMTLVAKLGSSIVADDDGEIVGHILLTRAELDDREILALGPLAVTPARQNRGVGTARQSSSRRSVCRAFR